MSELISKIGAATILHLQKLLKINILMVYTKGPLSLKVPIEIAIDKFFYVLSVLPAQQYTVILE